MKKKIILLVTFFTLLLSFHSTYAKFTDKKQVETPKLSILKPNDGIVLTSSTSSLDFSELPSSTNFNVTVSNKSSYTIKNVSVSYSQDGWKKYYSFSIVDKSISDDANRLFPENMKDMNRNLMKSTDLQINVNNKVATDKRFDGQLELQFTTVGNESITKTIDLTLLPKIVADSSKVKITGNQDFDFAKSDQDALTQTFTIENDTNLALNDIHITTRQAFVSDSERVLPLNASDTSQVQENVLTNFSEYFDVSIEQNFTSIAADQNSKQSFVVKVTRKPKAPSYNKIKVKIVVSAVAADANQTELTLDKDMNIIPILDSIDGNGHPVAWPIMSGNQFINPLFYGSDGNGYARTVFPMIIFEKTDSDSDSGIQMPEYYKAVVKPTGCAIKIPYRGFFAEYTLNREDILYDFALGNAEKIKRLYIYNNNIDNNYYYVNNWHKSLLNHYFTIAHSNLLNPANPPFNFINPSDYIKYDGVTGSYTLKDSKGNIVYTSSDAKKEFSLLTIPYSGPERVYE